MDFLFENIFGKFFNSQFCGATDSLVWMRSFIAMLHQPPCYKNESQLQWYSTTPDWNRDSQNWIALTYTCGMVRLSLCGFAVLCRHVPRGIVWMYLHNSNTTVPQNGNPTLMCSGKLPLPTRMISFTRWPLEARTEVL